MNCTILQEGCLDIIIDDMTPCLIDTDTGKAVNTTVFKIEKRNYLKKFQEKNGWHIGWDRVPDDVEVYALALCDTNEIEGLIGIRKDPTANAVYIHWACTAPHNNEHDYGKQKYSGVGGHLFAIAAEKSFEYGFEGYVHGFAANMELVDHYCEKLGAIYIGALHVYQIMLTPAVSKKLMEEYTYDWSDTEILGSNANS